MVMVNVMVMVKGRASFRFGPSHAVDGMLVRKVPFSLSRSEWLFTRDLILRVSVLYAVGRRT